ncbi:MAG: hemolysin [Chitinophagales bacterium]|nr:MAG: hemolysin [Chitinophagales bacterium]
MPIIIASIFFFILILASGLVSASEVSYFSLSEKEIRQLRQRKDRFARMILVLLSNPQQLLSTILICNSLINVAIVILSYYLFQHTFDFSQRPLLGFLINVLGVTFFIVLFGEVLPKVYATKANMQIARLMAVPLTIAGRLLYPFSFLLSSSTAFIEKRLKNRGYTAFSQQELEQAIDLTSDSTTSGHEVKILKSIVRFGDITVKQIMRPRVDIFAIDDSINYQELLQMVKEAGYSRIPVYRDNLDNIIGILYVKDLLNYLEEPADFKWHRLLRTPVFTPETKKIDALLKEIQQKGVHLLIAVDEYGGVSGLITLEDILEEIIGDIRDEYDVPEEGKVEKINEKTYLFDARVPLISVQTIMGLPENAFKGVSAGTDSIAGLVLELSGKMPAKNEIFTFGNLTLQVVSTGENRVKQVLITRTDDKKNVT